MRANESSWMGAARVAGDRRSRSAGKPVWRAAVLAAALSAPGVAGAWQPGTYPPAPARMHSSGFSVDTRNRNDVLSFWHGVYQASEGYEQRIGWTGNYNGSPGTISGVFVADVERRLNWFRAMCGVPADARVNSGSKVVVGSADRFKPPGATTKAAAAQAAALMMARNYDPGSGRNPAIDHDPAPSLIGWSPAAWNGNACGNLAFGAYGPGAIDSYMIEEPRGGAVTSSWFSAVGHRTWNLLPEATDYATGDQPGASATRPPTNVFYVLPHANELRTVAQPAFVAYPAPGFFPAPVNSPYWSLSRKGADFRGAAVRMTDAAGKKLKISNVRPSAGFGDPTLIWNVPEAAATRTVSSDRSFRVTVTGIGGEGVPKLLDYTVTLINPDRLLSDQSLRGSPAPVSNATTRYRLAPPPGAEALQVTAFRKKPGNWTEGAETKAAPKVLNRTSGGYPLISDPAGKAAFGPLSGNRAFNLTFPTIRIVNAGSIPDEAFELDRMLLPRQGAAVRFVYRRGFMTPGSSLHVESSADHGLTWKSLGRPIVGRSDNRYDDSTSTASYPLAKSTQPVRVRFRYRAEPGAAIFTHEAYPKFATGVFIDDIATTGCDWLEPCRTTTLGKAAKAYAFSARNAGSSLVEGSSWGLALRTKLGNRWFPYGPVTFVRIAAP